MKNKLLLVLLISGNIIFNPLFSLSQNTRIPAAKKMQMHRETEDDAYLPNAFQNKKTSPAYKYISPEIKSKKVGDRLMSTSVSTIQVNVNSNGQNILGDAGNEPNIAVNPVNPNEIVIGWRQFDNVSSNFRQAGWSYTTDAGLHWTFPGVINPGLFRSDPVLDYDANGNFYYNSLQSSFTTQIFKSNNGGASWDAGTNAGGGDKQWMTIDRTVGGGSGNIYSAWNETYSTCLPGFFTRSSNAGSSYENCTTVDGSPFWETMAVGNAGELYIAGADTLSDSIVVSKSLNAQIASSSIAWNTPVHVFMDGYLGGWSINPQGLMGQANIDVDRSNGAGRNNVYVLASVTRISNSDPGDVMFSRSIDGGLTWSYPVKINDDVSTTNTQWFGTMSVAPNGRIDAIWLDTRDNPGSDSSALYYSYSTDQGTTWSANEKLSASFDPHVGYPNQDKMGDYFDMISDNTGAHLAWANTLNGEEDVYYSRIIPYIINTGINEIANNSTVSIFPNPSNGAFEITMQEKPSQIEIRNTLGEKIYSKLSNQTTTEINISSQAAGIYFLKIIYLGGSSVVRKIIKE